MTSSRPKDQQPRPTLRLLRHLARTGGTVISKCLGCMDSVILLSEAHPLAMDQWTNLFEQANQWHGLTTSQEIKGWKKREISYAEVLGALNTRAEARGKALVVREWTHLDFVGTPFISPPMRAEATESLEEGFDLRIVDTVRHPLDHWLSISNVGTMRGISVDAHLAGCAAYAKQTHTRLGGSDPHLLVKYEDFCQSPSERLGEICELLKVPYDAGWESKWNEFTMVTGDTADSRGNSQRAISPLTRREPPASLVEQLDGHIDYANACQLWDYDPE